MLSKKMEEALNAQVNAEFWSAYLYLSMSNHFAAAGNFVEHIQPETVIFNHFQAIN